MKKLFSFAGRRVGGLSVAAAVGLVGVQLQCGAPVRDTKVATPDGRKDDAAAEGVRPEGVRLELTADRAELAPGQCAELRLAAFNPSAGPVGWGKDWVFEQEGPGAPRPEAFPRSDLELPPGATADLVRLRMCHADLPPGTHRYRISAAPTPDGRPRSNWVTLRVLP